MLWRADDWEAIPLHSAAKGQGGPGDFQMSKSDRVTFRVCDWVVDPGANELNRSGETQRIPPKMMAVLALLAENAGQVVTREELLDSVWPDVEVCDSVLTGNISKLRDLFGDDPVKPRVIQTIPKVGYRLLVAVEPVSAPARADQAAARPLTAKPDWLKRGIAAAAVTAVLLATWGAWRMGVTPLNPAADSTQSASSPPEQRSAQDFIEQGRFYFKLYRPQVNDRAVLMFEKAIELDPNSAQAYAGLADALAIKTARFGDDFSHAKLAVERAATAISLDPQLPEAYKAKGLAHFALGELDQAEAEFRRALELDPRFYKAVQNMAVIRRVQARLDGAIKWQKRAAQLEPLKIGTLNSLGNLHAAIGDYDTARFWLRKALELDPLGGDFMASMAWVALLESRPSEAETICRRALDKVVRRDGCLELLGELALVAEEPEQAGRYFQSVSDKGAYTELRLAQVEILTGDEAEGKKRLDAVLQALHRRVSQNRPLIGGERDYWMLAVISALKGQEGMALDWLERAQQAGWLFTDWDEREPAFEALRERPDFTRYLTEGKHKAAQFRAKVDALDGEKFTQTRLGAR